MEKMTRYATIGMVVALAKSIAKKYESVGIVDVSTSASGDKLIFTLANGTTHSVNLNFAAKGVTYDDTTTQMNVTNVQAAIEKIYSRGLQNVTSLNLTAGQEDVIYDTTDGITVTANATITLSNNEIITFDSQFNEPIIAGSGVSIDANQEGTKVIIKAVPEYITITAPAASTSGTLTQEQLTKLQSSDNVFISFNNEFYRLQSSGHLAGYLTYSMAEYENNVVTIKSITITINTLGWVLNTQTVGSVSIDNQSITENSNNQLQAVGLKYQDQSAITDLTNTTWIINATPSMLSTSADFYLDFQMNYYDGMNVDGVVGNVLKFSDVSTDPLIKMFDNTSGTQYATLYENNVWDSTDGSQTYTPSTSEVIQALRTITITGGIDVEDADIIAWLKANAVFQDTIITPKKIKEKIDIIQTNGDGSKYLNNNGSYTEISSVQKDNITITNNSNSQIQTVAVIDQKTTNANKQWTGTQAEYDALATKDSNTFYYITDGENVADAVIDQNTGNADKIFSGAKSDLPATLDTNTFYAYPSAGTYKGAWVTGTTYTEDDVVYVDTSSTVRAYYEMITVSDITSTTSPESDTTNWKKLFEVPVSSGGQLYNHIIEINQSAGVTFSIYLVIINNISTIFTDTTLANWLYNNNFTSSDTIYPCSSEFAASRVTATYNNILNKGVGVYSSNGTTPTILFTKAAFTISNSEISINTGSTTVYFSGTLTDTVTPL